MILHNIILADNVVETDPLRLEASSNNVDFSTCFVLRREGQSDREARHEGRDLFEAWVNLYVACVVRP